MKLGTRRIRTLNRRQLAIENSKNTSVAEYPRPKTRTECQMLEEKLGFCPYVGCRHHLYIDVCEKTGNITFNFPDLEVWEIPRCCSLNISDEGTHSLEEIGTWRNMTRERIRQIEATGLRAIYLKNTKETDEKI